MSRFLVNQEMRFPQEIRQVILDALPQETSLFGGTPDLRYTYVPASHAKALHPDSMLVVGIRGAGKSFWWAALQREDHRSLIASASPGTQIDRNMVVSQGFGEKSSPAHYPGKDALIALLGTCEARLIWRSIIAFHVLSQVMSNSPLSKLPTWKERVAWVGEHPEETEKMLYDADAGLVRSKTYHLILFDALDRCADDWPSMFKLVKGMLQVLLEFRSYSRIRPKAFVRPDHLEDPSVADFPDASKVLTQQVELNWPRHELYGLLWQYLANEPKNGQLFRDHCQVEFERQGAVWIIPERLRTDEDIQRRVFHAITGAWMGRALEHGWDGLWSTS